MKIWVSLIALLMTCISLSGQEIPNSGFESWVSFGNYENPEHWDTGNQTVLGVSIITTTKTNSSHSGTFAAQMETINFLTFIVPGLVTLGDFEVDIWSQQFSINGGIPYDQRPQRLNLYYTYNPAQGDKMSIGIWLLKNISNPVPDTVGIVLFESGENVSDYTLLSLDINYLSEDTPELMNIVAVSSNPDSPAAGSVLKIDDLEFDFTTGLNSCNNPSISIYPNPAGDHIMIGEKLFGYDVEIINCNGRKALEYVSVQKKQVDVSNLSPGLYLIIFSSPDKKQILSQKFIKR